MTNKEPDFLGFFDGYVKVTDEAIQRVYDYIVKLQPDYIFGPEPTYVYYIHEDHVNTGRILYFALKRISSSENSWGIRHGYSKIVLLSIYL